MGSFHTIRTYTHPHSGGWCHLLLLRSKNRYTKRLLAIITQTPDCHISIEQIATFILNFFDWFYPPHLYPDDEDAPIGLTPENTIFIEYLPAGCFEPRNTRKTDTIAVMKFSWQEVQIDHLNSYYQATQPSSGSMWNYTNQAAINDLIARL